MLEKTKTLLRKPLAIVIAAVILACSVAVAVYAGGAADKSGAVSAPLAARNGDGVYVYSVDTDKDNVAELQIADADMTSVKYLSDLYGTSAKVYSFVTGTGGQEISGARDYALDKNFGTKLFVFAKPNRDGRRQVDTGNSPRTINVNGVDTVYNYSDIALGGKGYLFRKGLGFLTSTPNNLNVYPAQLVYDVRNLKVDHFYGVAGIVGSANDEKNSPNEKTAYYVYGSKATTFADDAAMRDNTNWVELAKVENVKHIYTAEFNVDITGYNYVRLVCVNTGTTNSAGESAWGNACFYKLATSTASLSVSWEYGTQPVAERPTALPVTLYADGVAVSGKTATLSASNEWSVSFSDLPKFKAGTTTEIVYTVQPDADPDFYRKSTSGNTITYTYDPTLVTADVNVSAQFQDGVSDGSKRPTELVVELVADGVEQTGTTVTLNDANSWQGKFAKQPVYQEGTSTPIAYTFKVLTTSNFYTMSASGSVITCTYEANPTVSHGADIVWNDDNDALGLRPASVQMQLYADGVLMSGKVAEATDASGWSCEWTGLPKFNADRTQEIVYTVKLTADPDQYESQNNNDTFTLTCVPAANVYVTAVWEDNNNAKGTRPSSVTAQLYADGKPVSGKTLTLNAGNSWSGSWTKLDKYAADGETEIVYSFSASSATDYVQTVAGGTVTYTHVTSAATKFSNLGKAGVLNGLPAEANDKNTFYLSDLLNGKNSRVVSQYVMGENGSLAGRKFKAFTNYDGTLYVYTAGGTTRTKVTAPVQLGGVTYEPDDIAIGANGLKFEDGISFTASPSTGPDATIVYDLTGLDADYFYAVTGITGNANVNSDPKQFYLTYEVWGSKTGAESDYVKLAYSVDVRAYLINEFQVPITGYKYLKLVARSTGVSNAGGAAVWADACVYTLSVTPQPDPPTPDDPGLVHGDTSTAKNYTPSANGSYQGILKAAKDSVVALSEARYVRDSYILPSASNPNRRVRIDTTDLSSDTRSAAVIGTAKTKFSEHLTLHPTELSNERESFVDLDLTGLNVDRLYAAVGISADKGKTDGKGVVFSVYGLNQSNNYVMLATSASVYGYDSGEFNVDITGYTKLKLMVEVAPYSADYYSRTSSWCDIAAFRYDPNAADPVTPPTELSGYTNTPKGTYTGVTKAQNGKVIYLSDLKYTKAINNSNKATTVNYPYAGKAGDKITVGATDAIFKYGLGVHPKSGTSEAYTIYDLSGLDVDRFHAVVGITNANGKKGNSKGVIFQLYGDYTGNEKWTLISESDSLVKKETGEFDVNITGAQKLKLVVLSTTGDNTSSGSVWAGACVYKYDPKGKAPANIISHGGNDKKDDGKNDLTKLQPTDGFTLCPDGEFKGVDRGYSEGLTYLSDFEYLDSSNTTNADFPKGQPTTRNFAYQSNDLITLGEMERVFYNGLGMHPKNPSAPVDGTIESWTTYSLKGIQGDRFHATVGITNTKGKDGNSKGVVFRVYGETGDGNYKLLAHSGAIVGRMSGEFDLDITGMQSLRLAVVSASTTHTSSASAFADACIYDSTNWKEYKQDDPIIVPTQPDPTEPAEEPETGSEYTVPIIIGACALVLIAAAVTAVILLIKKKKAK